MTIIIILIHTQRIYRYKTPIICGLCGLASFSTVIIILLYYIILLCYLHATQGRLGPVYIILYIIIYLYIIYFVYTVLVYGTWRRSLSRRVHAWPRPYVFCVCVDVYIKIGTSIIPAGAGLINNYRLGAYCGTSKKKKKTPGSLTNWIDLVYRTDVEIIIIMYIICICVYTEVIPYIMHARRSRWRRTRWRRDG